MAEQTLEKKTCGSRVKNYFKTFDFSTATLTAAAPNIGYNNQIINNYGIFRSIVNRNRYI